MSFGMPGTLEILLILLLLALVFGARKLPELGRGLGEGIRNFRKSVKDNNDNEDSNNSDAKK